MRAAPKILDDEKNLLNFAAYLGDDMRIIRAGLGLEVRIKLARKVFPKIIVSSRNKAALRKSIMCTPPVHGYINYDSPKLRSYFVLLGKTFEYKKPQQLRRVLAIVHAYNEADVIERTIRYLVGQGVDVLLLDNYSTDNTYAIGQKMQRELGSRVKVKKFPNRKPTGNNYEWAKQLGETERLAKTLDYDWFIHYDADEIREAPFDGATLQEFISFVDELGYNAIDNTVIDFRLTSKTDDIFGQDGYYEFGTRPGHFLQVKTWRKCPDLKLAESGGHVATFDGKKVYPLKIICKHYPLRTLEQAQRKIFKDRLPRFEKEQKARGWHMQYSSVGGLDDLVYETDNLLRYSDVDNEKYRMQLVSGVGLRRDG